MDTLNVININGKDYDISLPTSNEYKKLMIQSFGDDYINKEEVKLNVTLNSSSVDGYFIELVTNITNPFKVEVYDEKEKMVYNSELSSGMFSKLNRKYYTKWKTKLFVDDLTFEHEFNLENSRVFIVFESSSLGDTLAWMPYCEEFRKKHNCHVIVSSFINSMFEDQYPEIEFVGRGVVVPNIKALYRLGWFYDRDKEPEEPNTIPLQKAATNILGLDFSEIRPKLFYTPGPRPIEEKYVTIGMSTTAGCKEWSHPNGWQTLINYLNNIGYKVAVIQKESFSDIENVLDWTGNKPLQERMSQIYHSEFYIGLGSGLSWLAWAVNKHVVMISNFSEDGHEFTDNTTRITNPLVCNGCWNNPMFKFDKGDWYWCPEHKGTERQFECHKSISPDMVIEQIQHLLK
jgi:autotransporter strand-loop-strand O-heptosyltransferase